MGRELGLSISELGMIDTASLLPYSLFQIYAGRLGDVYGARSILFIGLLLCSLSTVSISSQTSYTAILFLQCICGLGQALCYPACAKALAPWFDEQSRTTVLGLWGTCQAAGGLIGTIMCSNLVSTLGWRGSFFLPCALIMAVGWCNYMLLLTPAEVGVPPPNSKTNNPVVSGPVSSTITLAEALRIPTMPHVTLAFFSLKLIRYVFVLWLPMYFLHLRFSLYVSGLLAVTFEVGNAFGTACNGVIINRMFNGQKVKMVMMSCAALALCLACFIINIKQEASATTACISGLLIFLAGFAEPGFVISGPIATELGEYGGRNAQASLAGIVNGLGGFGAVVQGPIVGLIADKYGWDGVFYWVTVMCLLAIVTLIPAVTHERKQHEGIGYRRVDRVEE